MLLRKFVSIVTFTAAALSMALFTGQANAGKTIKLSHLDPDRPLEATMPAAARVFKQIVETQSNGEMKVQLYPAGQLGKDFEIVQQVRDGVVQSHIASVGGIATHYPLIDILNLPFAYPDISVTYTVLAGPVFDAFAEDMRRETGLQLLAFNDNGGFMHVTNSKRPITKLDDFKGLRIRTMTLKSHETAMAALGAKVTPMAWAELYTALQTGVVDGQMNPIPIIAQANFQEVQKYLTMTGHLFAPHIWIMNGKFYDSLTAGERQILKNAIASARVATQGIGRLIEATDRGLPKLAEKLKVNALDPTERKRMRDKALPAVAELIKTSYGKKGETLLNLFLEEIEKASP